MTHLKRCFLASIAGALLSPRKRSWERLSCVAGLAAALCVAQPPRGSVRAWGSNLDGELVNAAATGCNEPVQVSAIDGLVAMSGAGGTKAECKPPSQQRANGSGAFAAPAPKADAVKLAAEYGKLPLSFEPNQGQTEARVRFLSRGRGYTFWLTPTEAILGLRAPTERPERRLRSQRPQPVRSTVVRMKLAGANPAAEMRALEPLLGKSNYFIGNDPGQWRTGIPNYHRVKARGVYPGVDLDYYGTGRQLEFDFIVQPGGNPGSIRMLFDGAERLHIDDQGDLVISTALGEIRQHKPTVYQEVNGRRRSIDSRFVLKADRQVGFDIACCYDRSRPLIIDPVLVYSTYLGGSGSDSARAIAVDGSGNAYVVGSTKSTNFPTTSPFQTANSGDYDVFVAKLNAAGSALVYSTYLGGSSIDLANAIAVDGSGNAYVVGETISTNFPTASPFQAGKGGGADAFVAKLNAAGSALVYSTYLGGNDEDGAFGIAVDGSGNAYVAGRTGSTNFPTANSFQATNGGRTDAFVTKLNAAGSALMYSTYLGGSDLDGARGVAVDGAGNAYVAGGTSSTNFPTANPFQTAYFGGPGDAFVTKLSAAGSALVYSTYLGGQRIDLALGIAVDGSGNAYVAGNTSSSDFPTANPLQAFGGGFPAGDAFVTKLNAAGSALVYSTYLGGSSNDLANAIAVDGSGNAYVAGSASSSNFPTASPLQAANGGDYDAFVAKLNATGSALVYSTYLGGNVNDGALGVAVDGAGNAYVAGDTGTNFPTASPLQAAYAGGGDAFIAKIAPIPTATTVSAAAGQYSDPVMLRASVSSASGPVTSGSVQFSVNGVNVDGPVPADGTGSAATSYQILLAQGGYTIKAVYAPSSTLEFASSSGTNILTVSREDAVVTPSASNPTAVRVNVAGGTAGPIMVSASIVEKSDDTTNGDISLAEPITCTLTPLLAGSTYTVTAATSGGGVGGTLTATCVFPSIAVNAYSLSFIISGNYYTGSAQSVLAVYDPSLGFVTGGGTVLHNGFVGAFGFTAKYQPNGSPRVAVLYIEHRTTGDVMVQGQAAVSLSIVGNSAVIITKGVVNGQGNYTLITRVTDNGEPGVGADLFGLETKNPNGADVSALTFSPLVLTGGNIQVPHQ